MKGKKRFTGRAVEGEGATSLASLFSSRPVAELMTGMVGRDVGRKMRNAMEMQSAVIRSKRRPEHRQQGLGNVGTWVDERSLPPSHPVPGPHFLACCGCEACSTANAHTDPITRSIPYTFCSRLIARGSLLKSATDPPPGSNTHALPGMASIPLYVMADYTPILTTGHKKNWPATLPSCGRSPTRSRRTGSASRPRKKEKIRHCSLKSGEVADRSN
ncbi:hypothetical protein B0T25DRAFT_332533 [Lasiosphaeria hispida]|uniref:Uncharacterized protein n=1 Tax=Lasiosphaeria hispida TaxID=260671 RepID=A0AAJ0H5V3_9PEZI|nr:hypothetical protein B0T25DRAFT_332533 [Lasiosphaeria hispida]